jgi:hypothetical protein
MWHPPLGVSILSQFWSENKELIVAAIAFLGYALRDKLFPAWMSVRRQEREAAASLTDRLFVVLDRQVQSMEDTSRLIRDSSIVLQSIVQNLSNATSTMGAKHDITHMSLREILNRHDVTKLELASIKTEIHDIDDALTYLFKAQNLALPRKKVAARPRPGVEPGKDGPG